MIDKSKSSQGQDRQLVSGGASTAADGDDALFAYFLHLVPPAAQVARMRLEKLLPALVLAHANGNKVRWLVDALKAKGINVSAVTLRKKISAYQADRRNDDEPDVLETV